MKILIEPQIFNLQVFGGISRYYTEIVSEIKLNNLAEVIIPLYHTTNIHLDEKQVLLTNMNLLERLCYQHNIFKNKIIRRLKRKSNEDFLNTMKSKPFDLLIPTYYNPYFLEIFQKKPFVLTVYDMIHELYPHCFKKEDKTSEWKQMLIPKATKIIAISESTKSDLLRFYPTVNPDDIHVVYLSYSAMNSQVKVPNLPKKYVLFIGNREHYKNFKFFARSMKSLLDKYDDLTIFCAGGSPFYEEEMALFMTIGHENKFIQYNFKDNELAHIYQKAECFVFPSEYEGFGIPVLEAMANNCPCILARHSSFPEVAGEAGIYFELNNGTDLSDKVELTINDRQFRKEMVEKGLENLKRFSWEKTARACVDVYELAMEKSLTAL